MGQRGAGFAGAGNSGGEDKIPMWKIGTDSGEPKPFATEKIRGNLREKTTVKSLRLGLNQKFFAVLRISQIFSVPARCSASARKRGQSQNRFDTEEI